MKIACPSCGGSVGVLAIREGKGCCPSCGEKFAATPHLGLAAGAAPAGADTPATVAPVPSPSDSARSDAAPVSGGGARGVDEEGDTRPPETPGRKASDSQRSMPADIVPALEQAGPYQVLGEVARGGMGVVYKARDRHLRRLVAIKVLRGAGGDADEVARFRREAEASARLQHSNIVPIHAVGEVLGRPFFVMDFIEGRSLQDLVRSGELSPRAALDIAEQTAEALHYAHRQGVIHRDLKPANIIVDRLGRPQVMDFGLAKQIDDEVGLTKAGTTMGTPAYMPPEQAEGDLAEIDEQSDVYSLGALLYEMLTDRPPFQGTSTMNILMKVLKEEPVPPRKINPRIHRDVETICLKAMDKEKSRRYETARDLAEDIRRFRAGEAISAAPAGAFRRARRALARNAPIAAGAALLVVLSAGATGYVFYRDWAGRKADRLMDERRLRSLLASVDEKLDEAEGTVRERPVGWQKDARRLLDTAARAATLALTLRPASLEAKRNVDRARAAVRDLRVAGFLELAAGFLEEGQLAAAEKVYGMVLENLDPGNVQAAEGLKRARGVGKLWLATNPPGVEVAVLGGPEPGEVVFAGRTPLEGVDVESGRYRLLLSGETIGRHELPLEVGRSADVRLGKLRLPRQGATASGAVLVPAGRVDMPGGARVDVRAFVIDRYESGAGLGEVPRSGLSWVEAAASCRSAHKRLCRASEWRRACSGDLALAFPYGRTFDASRCSSGALTTAARAGARPGCVSQWGVYDMSGNVSEWVGTAEKDALIYGGDWSVSEGAFLGCRSELYRPPREAALRTGFRCCRDAAAGR